MILADDFKGFDMQQRLVTAIFMGILATMTLTGCQKSIKPQERKPAKLVKLEQSVSVLSPVAAVSLPQTSGRFGKKFNKKDTPDLHVAILSEGFAGASRSGVVGVYAVDGRQLWSLDIKEEITSGVGVNSRETLLVVGTHSGKVLGIDTKTQTIKWQKNLPSSSLTPALVADDRVMVSANDGVIYALDSKTGEQVWQFSTQTPAVSVRGIATPLSLDEQAALFGTADGRIHAINPQTGEPLWTRRVGRAVGGSQVHRMSDIDGMPLVMDNYLYVASYSGQLMGFDMSTGQMMFVREFASIKALAGYGDWVIGASTDGDVVAFDRITGKTIWENSELKYRKLTNPVVIGQYIFVGDLDGVVHIFDIQGKIVGRTQTKGKLSSLQTNHQKLYAQSADDVVSIWRSNEIIPMQ